MQVATGGLAAKLKVSASSTGLDVLQALERAARAVANVRPSDEIRPVALLRELRSDTTSVYIDWGRFNDIDEMNADDFNSVFHDLWYPSSDDIEVFDKTLSWVLLVRHFDVVQTVKL